MSRDDRRHLSRNDNVTRILTETDRYPENTILPILHANAGRSILIRVYRNGRLRRKGTLPCGDQFTFRREQYDVPALQTGNHPRRDINNKFRGRIQEGWVWDWLTGSDRGGLHLDVGDELRVFQANTVLPRRRAQRFASGVSHCIITPIRTWATTQLELQHEKAASIASSCAVPGSVRQACYKFRRLLKTLDEYETRYKDGIPQEAFQDFVDALGKSKHVHIVIELPQLQRYSKLPPLIDVRSALNTGKRFNFVNTQIDHADLNEVTSKEPIIVTQEALNDLVADLDDKGTFYTFQQTRFSGITSVSTLQGTYRLQSDYYDAVREFEQITFMDYFKIDAVKQPELSDFVQQGLHFNLPNYAPHGSLPPTLQHMRHAKMEYIDAKRKEVALETFQAHMDSAKAAADKEFICLDMKKSYATFYHFAEYEGFPTKFTTLRPFAPRSGTFIPGNPGVYRIVNLDWTHASRETLMVMDILAHPYRDGNVYTRPELKKLYKLNVRFEIVEGAYADGFVNDMNFEFPGDPKNDATGEAATGFYRKDPGSGGKPVPFYSKYIGACASVNKFETYWLKGSKEYLENLAAHLPRNTRIRQYDDGAAQIEFPRRSAKHLTQITAYINAYERLKMFDQLLRIFEAGVPLTDVVWFDKDDVTVRRGASFEVLPYMSEKPVHEKMFSSNPIAYYVANLWQNDVDDVTCPYPPLTQPYEQRPGGMVACLGVGGGGKTHVNLIDTGHLQCGLLYVAPSHALKEDKMQEYNVQGTTYNTIFGTGLETVNHWRKECAVIVWDEISQKIMIDLQAILNTFPYHKHILCGDPGYQLPPQSTDWIDELDRRPVTEAYLHRGVEFPMSNDFPEYGSRLDALISVPIHRFDHSYRIKCNHLRTLCNDLRHMIDHECTEAEMHAHVLSVLRRRHQVLTFDQCIARFCIDDGIVVSKHELEHEYTTALSERKFYNENGERIRRFRVLERAPLANGRIITAPEAPFTQCVERYATTAHSYQGMACKTVLYIDSRHMFEPQHWYTCISRAEYIRNLFVVEVSLEPPAEQYARTLMYRIVSPHTHLVYVGHTTDTLEKRMARHRRDFDNRQTLKKKCSSVKVFEHGEARIQLLEKWPCASLSQAKIRERHWIQKVAHCVNMTMPGGKRPRGE